MVGQEDVAKMAGRSVWRNFGEPKMAGKYFDDDNMNMTIDDGDGDGRYG